MVEAMHEMEPLTLLIVETGKYANLEADFFAEVNLGG